MWGLGEGCLFVFCGGCSSFWERVVFRMTLTSYLFAGITGMCHHTKYFLLATLDIKRSYFHFHQICNLFLWAWCCRPVNLRVRVAGTERLALSVIQTEVKAILGQ